MNRLLPKNHVHTGLKFAMPAVVVLVISLMGLHAQAVPDEPEPSTRKSSVRKSSIRDFKLRDQYGREIKLSGFRGQYVHLDFSAVWCGPCHKQARYMARLERELEGYGFTSISIIVTRNPAAAKRWAKRYGLKYVLMDNTRDTRRKFNVRGYPTNIILRPNLTVAGSHAGAHRSPRIFRGWLKKLVPEMFQGQRLDNNNAARSLSAERFAAKR